MHIAFTDQKSAFDRVNTELLWEILENGRINGLLPFCVTSEQALEQVLD